MENEEIKVKDFEKIVQDRDFDSLLKEHEELNDMYWSADFGVRHFRNLCTSLDKKLKDLKKFVNDLSGENEEYAKISDILSIIE